MAETTIADLAAAIREALTIADDLDELVIGCLLSSALDRLSDKTETE